MTEAKAKIEMAEEVVQRLAPGRDEHSLVRYTAQATRVRTPRFQQAKHVSSCCDAPI